MRLGVFVSIFGAILLILTLIVPVPIGPELLAGGQPPLPGSPPACLELTYEKGHKGSWMPASIRLDAERARTNPSWHRADGGPGDGLYHLAGWRPAGPDSIDIAWHHSPILRLPARGDTLVGRAAASRVMPLFPAIELRDFAVRAVRVSCR